MDKKKTLTLPVLCLGAAALLCAAFAVFMLAAPGAAPRLNAAPSPEEVEVTVYETVGTASKITLYEGPKTMTTSENAKISVNGSELFVYDVMVNHEHIWNENTMPSETPMTYFDFEGEAAVSIRMPKLRNPVESAVVMPAAAGIVPTVADGTVSFTLTEPGQYTVVYNGSVNMATHIFANPPETDIPDKNDPNVIFIEPGEWEADAIALKSDQTLYISGGAVLHAPVLANNAVNVTVRGRGIIDAGSGYDSWVHTGNARVPLDFVGCKNIVAEGITFINSNCWNFNSNSSENADISNIKVISGRQNGDGFTFQSCKNFVVRDSFCRSWDDTLVIKNYSSSLGSDNITFENIQIWTDLAQSMEIGYETNKGKMPNPEISNITFKDITVLYNFHKPVISIHNSDNAYIHDILYQNIVVENALMQGDNGRNKELIEMTLAKSGWSAVTDEFGITKGVVIDGLTVLNTADGKVPASRFAGADAEHQIEDVTIRNVTILGEAITGLDAMNVRVEDFCSNITVE
ncbi:MAG: hypothetical protein LBR76_05825 [Oscillospiraceae bacterium]|jgi:hypothetical protein|nr:hypothetical protein [Oscillospiraceae bacterium]